MSEPDAADLAETVIDALENYQRLTMEIFEAHPDDPERCIKDMVRLHLTWTGQNPDTARLINRHRNEVAAGAGRERLAAGNKAFFNASRDWMKAQIEAGRLPSMSFNVLHAIVFAPSQELAKLYLSERLRKQPGEYAEAMGKAAWAGLMAVGNGRQSTD